MATQKELQKAKKALEKEMDEALKDLRNELTEKSEDPNLSPNESHQAKQALNEFNKMGLENQKLLAYNSKKREKRKFKALKEKTRRNDKKISEYRKTIDDLEARVTLLEKNPKVTPFTPMEALA